MHAQRFRAAFRAMAVAAALSWVHAVGGADAQDRAPLLVEGKSTVYQRVLAKPNATLHAQPGGPAGSEIRPFQPLYVYARRPDGWIEVGRGRATGPEGWTSGDRVVEWRQNIVVSFSNAAGRERQLLFETEEALMRVVRHESPIGVARELRRRAIEEGPGAAEGVVAIEPREYIDINENFYLFPILDWRIEEHPMTFTQMRSLRVASLPLEEADPNETEEAAPSAGLVFVIDTTRSMEPYIEATRQAVREIVDRIRGSPVGENIRFGAVGFRDSPEAARRIDPARDVEYRTRVYLPLAADQSPEDVLRGYGDMEEARASTVNFHEDAVAGIIDAIGFPGWEDAAPDGRPVRQRYVVVISDASPKPPGDPDALHRYDPAGVAEIAASRGITIAALHLRTPDGAPNHRAAEAAYTEMTRTPTTGRPLYFPVDLTSRTAARNPVGAFRPAVDQIVSFVVEEHARTIDDLLRTREQRELSPLEEASLAMRLAWLGRDRDVGAPEIIEAYTIDYALEDPLTPALDVRLLLTKNQLSTMSEVLREIIAIGETAQGDADGGDFFELLRGAFARLAQDPDNLVNTRFETLDEAVGEFLGDLPYQSPLLGITPEDWASMGSQRRVLLDRVTSRLALYEHFHDDPSVWTALYEGAPDGEHVFAMPFEMLP